jgi:glycosyltransferase involved in cell wall biosynthesis
MARWRDEWQPPRVSIGLPVYNGAAFLGEAIESILAQTFRDFELILSDNASTDATPEICQTYAARDPRIRYFRNETNIGGAGNFSRVFRLGRGEYFKWAADDDVIAPEFVERCVEVLDRDPSLALCFSKMQIIDSVGRVVRRRYDNGLKRLGSERAHERFADMLLTGHGCFHSFGLARASLVAQTPLFASYIGSDRSYLAELSLRGRFFELEEDLFGLRDHADRSVKALPFYERMAWVDPSAIGRPSFPHWRLLREYGKSIRRSPLARGEKLRCAAVLGRWLLVNANAARLGLDLVVAILPGASRLQSWAKEFRTFRRRKV